MNRRSGLGLVMPMAGRGSRFARLGIREPKPLIDLAGRPFFWWAVESLRRVVPLRAMVFVVLDEHCRDFDIDSRIRAIYPEAQVLSIPDVTSGAAETARIGIDALVHEGPVAINDCDHAFFCPDLSFALTQLATDADKALLSFESTDPAYSYVVLGPGGRPTGTVEKVVASPYAIAGCYFFSGVERFRRLYEAYEKNCPYGELFISGLFNQSSIDDTSMLLLHTSRHWSFGTPEELERTDRSTIITAFAGFDA